MFANNIKGYDELPLKTIDVEGKWDGEKNVEEANRVVELVKDLLVNRKNNETIGIVTLNVNQRDLILDLFEEEARKDKNFGLLYSQERDRRDEETNEDKGLFVKNLESVQGDERDIIVFSISYSKNEKGKIGSSLGELQRQYGENRLNVAISRAKRKIYIIKSFMGIDLKVNESNKGPYYFKKYLMYADYLNSFSNEASSNVLLSLKDENTMNRNFSSTNWFVNDMYNELIKKIDLNIYDVKKNVEIGSFTIDLAIYEKSSNKCILNIECYASTNYESESEVSDSIYQQYYLQVRGYDIFRVWVTDWFDNKEAEVNRIIEKLNSYMDNSEFKSI